MANAKKKRDQTIHFHCNWQTTVEDKNKTTLANRNGNEETLIWSTATLWHWLWAFSTKHFENTVFVHLHCEIFVISFVEMDKNWNNVFRCCHPWWYQWIGINSFGTHTYYNYMEWAKYGLAFARQHLQNRQWCISNIGLLCTTINESATKEFISITHTRTKIKDESRTKYSKTHSNNRLPHVFCTYVGNAFILACQLLNVTRKCNHILSSNCATK